MIRGTTHLVGLLGHPVGHSLSPAMHNSAMEYLGIDMCYVAFDVDPADLERALDGLRSINAVGTNITIPHKEAAFRWVDELDPAAEKSGAVNTVVFGRNGSKGYNTDIIGVRRTLSGLAPARGKAMVLGAGGAARGVLCALLEEGFESIFIANRTRSKAEALAEELSSSAKRPVVEILPWGTFPDGGTDLLVNATSLGLGGNSWPKDILGRAVMSSSEGKIIDMVYSPDGRTPLTSEASDRGIPSSGGEEVLLGQGIAAFELFTGRDAPLDVMRRALREGRKVS